MVELSPSVCAELAQKIYQVQNPIFVEDFLDLSYFKKRKGISNYAPHKYLKAEVGGRILLNTKDGFGVCAEGGEKNKNELFLIFRGTTTSNNGADILTDARMGIKTNDAGLPVHCGFHHCFSSMVPGIRDFFASHSSKAITAVHCIGHSLGGAIASLAADWVARNYGLPVKLYSFGAPRVGTDWFVKSSTTKIGQPNMYRVYHRTDPVPMVPLYPFMHAPYKEKAYFIHSSEPLNSGIAHQMARYIESCTGKGWRSFSDAFEQGYTIEAAIQAWLSSKTPVNSNSANFWRWIDSALIYVVKKIAAGALLSLQSGMISIFTLADKLAYILVKGIDLTANISIWVERLMQKLMQALGMALVKNKEQLSHYLIRQVLIKLHQKANSEARKALRSI